MKQMSDGANGFITQDEAREILLEFIRKMAGPRDDGTPELVFAIRKFGQIIPWDYLDDGSRKQAARAMSALHEIRDRMREAGTIIRRYWPEGNGGSHGREVARSGSKTGP